LRPTVDAAGNVSARVGGREPAIAVAAHLDTVFEGLEPIAVSRNGEVLSAPGIGDNSLGLAGLLFLARRVTAGRWRGRRPLVLTATVGEEGLGNLQGAIALLDRVACAEFVALEGGMRDDLVTRGVGSRRFELVASAPGGHSWRDRGEPSAIHELMSLLDKLVQSAPAMATNVGKIAGGTGVNVLASEANALVEFRDLSNRRLAASAALLRRRALDAPVDISVRELGTRPAGRTPRSHPLVRAAMAARRAAGLSKPTFSEASTDANAALVRGIPAITVGLGQSHAPHTLEERVDTAGLDRALTALAALLDARTTRAARAT
jgi:tripeptide aminopeptidase